VETSAGGGLVQERRSGSDRTLLWYGFAALWLLDAWLALTPNMGLDQIDIVLMGGFGQPAWYINFISNTLYYWIYHHHLANALMWVEFSVQAAVAVAMVVGRDRGLGRWALWVSIVWAVLVWVLAEWMGSLVSGMNFWTGSPGAALLYVYGAVWLLLPAARTTTPRARQRARQMLGAWWLLGALVECFPGWWSGTALATEIRGSLVLTAASLRTEPIQWWVNWAAAAPAAANAVLVAAMAAVGATMVWGQGRRATVVFVMVFLALLWWWGENLGGMFGGIATDPNTAPVWMVLMAAAWRPLWGARPAG
jgi:hypothetical protein